MALLLITKHGIIQTGPDATSIHSLTCYTCKYLTDANEHILWDLPPDGQVSSMVHHTANGLVDGLLLHQVQSFTLQDSWN